MFLTSDMDDFFSDSCHIAKYWHFYRIKLLIGTRLHPYGKTQRTSDEIDKKFYTFYLKATE